MKRLVLLAMVAVGGCSSSSPPIAKLSPGPLATDLEHSFQIVWESVYGMSVDTRPTITWWEPCPDQLTGAASDPICASEYSTPGAMNVAWTETLISDTHFSAWLDAQRIFILYPTYFPSTLPSESERLTRAAQTQLRSAGL